MSEKEAPYIVQQSTALTVPEVMSIGETMAKSGYFDDARQAAQAIVKILAGREMGFGPFASMTGISIIKGKPVIQASLMAAAVRANPRYDYKVLQLDDEACELAFYRDGAEVGRSRFDKQDATAAEVGRMVAPGAKSSMMQRFPRNMLFARAMSNGVKWYCPDAFTGATVYTPDELGEEIAIEADIVDVTPTEPESITSGEPVTVTEEGEIAEPHWIDDDYKRSYFWAKVGDLGLDEKALKDLVGIDSIHNWAGTANELLQKAKAALGEQAELVEVPA